MANASMRAKNSEIRSFLLRHAGKRGILVREHISDWRDGPAEFYCHVQSGSDPTKTATALSLEGPDNALVMAFLAYGDSSIDFLD